MRGLLSNPLTKKALAVVGLFLILQLLYAANFRVEFLPSPIAVVVAFWRLLVSGAIFPEIVASSTRVLVGFCLATLAGGALGLLLALRANIGQYASPILELLRPIPPIAWVPLAILIFGLGNGAAYFIVFIGTFFPIFTNTYFGARSLPKVLQNTCESYEIKGFTYLFRILFFYSLPFMFTGLKIGMGMAWMSVIAAELVGVQGGLGYFIQYNRLLLNIDNVIAGMLFIGLVGLCFGGLLSMAERAAIPWRPEKK